MADQQYTNDVITCDCESYDCRGECCGLGNCSCSGEYLGAKVDVILPDGTHTYWSTHCRHGAHGACSATLMQGEGKQSGFPVQIRRKPAQCKTCASPCICPCHAGSADG